MFKDYYKILGVSPSADDDVIKKAYREMSKKWHPDRNPNDDVTAIMQDINEAYAILKDETKRLRYDREYVRFCRTFKQEEKSQKDEESDEKKYPQSEWTHKYNVQDENLNEDIKNAREYAKELVEKFLEELKKTSKAAIKGGWDGVKGYLYAATILSIVGLCVRECIATQEHNPSLIADWQSESNAVEAPIKSGKTVLSVDTFHVPKTWTKYYIANQAFSLSVPPIVELRHEYDEYVKRLQKLGLSCNTDDIVFQQKDLANYSAKALSHYCRIMIQHISGNENEFPLPNETFPLDSEMRAELREIIDNELGFSELIGEPFYCWININDIKAIEIRYHRTGSKGNTTACRMYLLFNGDEMVKMIVSYREQESEIWLPDLANVIKTFKWEISKNTYSGSKNEINNMDNKIYNSLKPFQTETSETNEQKSSIKEDKTYSTSYYYIKYPKDWKVAECTDGMTDAYFCSQQEDLGFSIVRFETDYSLSNAHSEGNNNIKEAGFRILEDKQITFAGVGCYRTLKEARIQGKTIKHLSYTFKKGDMLYGLSFGNVTTKEREILCEEIANSFHFKKR